MLKKIIHSPYLNLISGLVLIFTAGYEVWISIEEEFLGSHHGILVFGLVHFIRALPEVLLGLKEINEADELAKEEVAT